MEEERRKKFNSLQFLYFISPKLAERREKMFEFLINITFTFFFSVPSK